MEDKKQLWIVDPRGSNRERARQMGYQIVDLVVRYMRAFIIARPVVSS